MAATTYVNNSATVGKVSDNNLFKPSGDGLVQLTPTVPAASAQFITSGSSAGQYTKSSSTVLVVNYASTPPFGSAQSLLGVFWTTAGVNYYCLDCTQVVSTNQVTITCPTTIPAGITANGSPAQTNFATITPGTTKITVAVSTQGTDVGSMSYPQNVDLTSFTIPIATLQQLLLTQNAFGAFECFATPVGSLGDSANGVWVGGATKTLTVSGAGWVVNSLVGLAVTVNSTSVGTVVSNTATVITTSINGSVTNGTYSWSIASPNLVLYWNYAQAGQFFNWPPIQVGAVAPYAGNITKIRCYNNSMSDNQFGIGANLSS